MGIWISHGEGKALFPDQSIKDTILRDNLAPIRYSDDAGVATESYPFNPNGSPEVGAFSLRGAGGTVSVSGC